MKHARRFGIAGITALAVAGSLVLVAYADHHEGAAQPVPVTLEGEVIDLQCALLHPDAAAGSEHATCAKACLAKGLPAGLKVGDRVYLLLAKDHGSVKHLAKHAGTTVKVTGVVAERFGLTALRVDVLANIKAAATKETWMCPMGCVKSDKPGKCPACGMVMEKSKG